MRRCCALTSSAHAAESPSRHRRTITAQSTSKRLSSMPAIGNCRERSLPGARVSCLRLAIGAATTLIFVPPTPWWFRLALWSRGAALRPFTARAALSDAAPTAEARPIWFQEITPTQLILKGYAAPSGLVPDDDDESMLPTAIHLQADRTDSLKLTVLRGTPTRTPPERPQQQVIARIPVSAFAASRLPAPIPASC